MVNPYLTNVQEVPSEVQREKEDLAVYSHPFQSKLAPVVFTALVKNIISDLCYFIKVNTFAYLDDFLTMASSEGECIFLWRHCIRFSTFGIFWSNRKCHASF